MKRKEKTIWKEKNNWEKNKRNSCEKKVKSWKVGRIKKKVLKFDWKDFFFKFNDPRISHRLGLCNTLFPVWNAILSNRSETMWKINFHSYWGGKKIFFLFFIAQTCEIFSCEALRHWLACSSKLRKCDPRNRCQERYFLRFSSSIFFFSWVASDIRVEAKIVSPSHRRDEGEIWVFFANRLSIKVLSF